MLVSHHGSDEYMQVSLQLIPPSIHGRNMEDIDQELEKLRSIVEHRLGTCPPAVIVGVADIVLWILNCDDHRFTNKRVAIENLLNPIADQVFEQMLQISKHRMLNYSFGSDDGHSITAMEDIMAYNMLIRVYGRHIDDDRNKAFKMLSILKNQSTESKEAQREMIVNLLDQTYDEVDWDLFVFIIGKLFPDFVCYWDDSASKGEDDPMVIDTSPVFTNMGVPYSLEPFGFGFEEELCPWRGKGLGKIGKASRKNCRKKGGEGASLGSGGFEESENELSSAGASASLAFQDHHQHLFPSRKGNGGASKERRDKDEKPFSMFSFTKSIFRHE